MGLLSDYLYAHSGNEAPDSFYIWPALTLMGHVVGTKVYYMNGAYKTLLSLYCGLIGSAGSAKSTGKNAMKDILVENFPTLLCSANIQTREDVIKIMGGDDNVIAWKCKATNKIIETHPFFIIANEFQNFLSVNPIGMITFLVDIHGEKHYSDSYKNQGKNSFPNPHMSILSCATKDWVMSELKLSLLSGGLGRRLILVVDESDKIIPFPHRPNDWKPYYDRVVSHLHHLFSEESQGELIRTSLATKWYEDWYPTHKKNKPEDPILQQFHSTEHVMLMKVASLLVLEDYSFKYELTDDHFERARLLIDSNKPKIAALSSGIGRNELASYGQKIIDLLLRMGGALQRNKVEIVLGRDLRAGEFQEQLDVLTRTKGLVQYNNPQTSQQWLFLKDRYELLLKEQADKNKTQPPTPLT